MGNVPKGKGGILMEKVGSGKGWFLLRQEFKNKAAERSGKKVNGQPVKRTLQD